MGGKTGRNHQRRPYHKYPNPDLRPIRKKSMSEGSDPFSGCPSLCTWFCCQKWSPLPLVLVHLAPVVVDLTLAREEDFPLIRHVTSDFTVLTTLRFRITPPLVSKGIKSKCSGWFFIYIYGNRQKSKKFRDHLGIDSRNILFVSGGVVPDVPRRRHQCI